MTLKLLIADDSATIQKIVTLAFGCEDIAVESVSDGSSALDAIRTFKPDVILADIFMPGPSGYEICERVKENSESAHVPVVLLTGTFEPFDEAEASRVKCDGHLIKPFDTAELVETVLSLATRRMTTQSSGTPVEKAVMHMQDKAAQPPDLSRAGSPDEMRLQVWDSFLSSNRILDLFDAETIKEAERMRMSPHGSPQDSVPAAAPKAKTPVSGGEALSEEALNLIVHRVMQRMSADVIREIAWEVVPEMSESIIRRAIEEQNKP